MSEAEFDLEIELGPLGKRIRELRKKLKPDGPDVDYAELYAFVDADLPEDRMREIGTKVSTWQSWHDAFWEIRSSLGLVQCPTSEAESLTREAIRETLSEFVAEFTSGRRPIAEFRPELAIAYLHEEFYGGRTLDRDARVSFLRLAGEAIAESLAEHAARLGQQPPDSHTAGQSEHATVAQAEETTLAAAERHPAYTIGRHKALMTLKESKDRLALVYTLSAYAGCESKQIADLLASPLEQIQDELRAAGAVIHVNAARAASRESSTP